MPDQQPQPSLLVRILTWVIQAWLLAALIWFIIRGDVENIFLTLTVIGLIMLPPIILRKNRIRIPPEFQLIAAAFVFLTLFLGSAADLYYEFWWWDMVLHLGSGFLLGVVGWIFLFILIQSDRLPRGTPPSLIWVFSVTFAMTVAVLWEIFEYIVDVIWPHINMMSQETGVHDTMHDLITDFIGAIVVACMGYIYHRTGKTSFLHIAIKGFMKLNPRLFKKRRAQKSAA